MSGVCVCVCVCVCSGGLLDSSLEAVKTLHSQLLCNDSLQKPATGNSQRNKASLLTLSS